MIVNDECDPNEGIQFCPSSNLTKTNVRRAKIELQVFKKFLKKVQ